MKKLNGKYKPPPPLSVIEAARAGEADAMKQILRHYDGYINKLCLRTIIDESGQPHKQVDPYMKGRLQSKLMQAIKQNRGMPCKDQDERFAPLTAFPGFAVR